jgi:hypothetical protein
MTEQTQQLSAAEQAKANRIQAVVDEFPVGQLVRLRGGDYPGNEGKVTDIRIKADVPYVHVVLEVFTGGRRRPDNRKPEYDMRPSSLEKIEAYTDVPTAQPAGQGGGAASNQVVSAITGKVIGDGEATAGNEPSAPPADASDNAEKVAETAGKHAGASEDAGTADAGW